MLMPRIIPVNPGTKLRIVHLEPNFDSTFIRAAIPAPRDALKERKAGVDGILTSYLWTGYEYFLVEREDGVIAVHCHSEVHFLDPRVYLPDCKKCGCFAISHIPIRQSRMRIRCTSCCLCGGYEHPSLSPGTIIDPDMYYDPETGTFEKLDPEDCVRG